MNSTNISTPNEVLLQKLILLQTATKELAVVQATTGIRGTAHFRVYLLEQMIQAEQKKNEKSESAVTPFDRTTDATRQSDEQLQKW